MLYQAINPRAGPSVTRTSYFVPIMGDEDKPNFDITSAFEELLPKNINAIEKTEGSGKTSSNGNGKTKKKEDLGRNTYRTLIQCRPLKSYCQKYRCHKKAEDSRKSSGNEDVQTRFAEVENKELDSLVEKAQAIKTKEATKWAVSVL